MDLPLLLVGLRLGKLSSSIQVGYHLTFSTEDNFVGNMVEWFRNVDSWTELGRAIRITHRIVVRNMVLSNHIITESNLIDDLKPKGMDSYRWCCCFP